MSNMQDLLNTIVARIAEKVGAAAAEIAQAEMAALVDGAATTQAAVEVVHEYVRSNFGNIITLPQYDAEVPFVDLEDLGVQDALDLDAATNGSWFYVNVYRKRVAAKGDKLGTNGYVLGKKLFSSAAEAYRRRKGRLGKDAGYEGVIEITPRQARAKGYTVPA